MKQYQNKLSISINLILLFHVKTQLRHILKICNEGRRKYLGILEQFGKKKCLSM